MRIAIVKRTPGITFSMDVYARNLVHALAELYPEVEILEISPQPWWENEPQNWKAGSGIKKYYERYYNHPKKVAKVEADIFHILDHTDGHIANHLHKVGKKVVVTCHDLVQFVYPEILRDQARWPWFSLNVWKYSVQGMTRANHVITVSRNTKKDVAKYLSLEPKRITAIPNAVSSNFQVLSSESIQRFRDLNGSQSGEICLLNVGSTHSRKNILQILVVLKQLIQDGLPVRLWRTGGNFTAAQENYIRAHQLDDFILDFGRVDEAQLIQIYNAADILLAPSLYEGFGLTILEAMACGCPVIASNCSSLPEVAGDAAILVNPSDPQNSVDAVKLLINEKKLYAQLVTKGLERAKQFSWKHTANQVFEIYLSLLDFPIDKDHRHDDKV